MNIQDVGIGGAIAVAVTAFGKWVLVQTSSKEKIRLRELDIEEAGRKYANAVMQEYKEKQDQILVEIHENRLEIEQLKQLVIRLKSYITSIVTIAESNIKDNSMKDVITKLHKESQEIEVSFKNK